MAKAKIPDAPELQSNIQLKSTYKGAIALPSYNESETLPEVLASLCNNDPKLIDETLIIINVNNRLNSDANDNQKTLAFLKSYESPLQLAWLDATDKPLAYPDKFGVGLARHQACTATLHFLSDQSPIISLDGDSPVNTSYLENIYKHFQNPKHQAAHVNFQHRFVTGSEEEMAIRLYDKHLHQHRAGLEKANSPHAWYAIGSTIVCTKKAYVKSGGYNPRRMAGEDFYLLQQLSKTGNKISIIEDAWVYPSNRQSDRVPFGTGKAVNEIVEEGHWHTYAPECYDELGKLIQTIEQNLNMPAEDILTKLSLDTQQFLQERKFTETWPKLQKNSKGEKMLRQRFHEWLDAFQTLKLIHFLTEKNYPKIPVKL
ncbi:MAG: glycosyltransferase [Lentisphaeraceae bacterium]|nr:glycosyltransferase [Lentisphaeraceae bacterium]